MRAFAADHVESELRRVGVTVGEPDKSIPVGSSEAAALAVDSPIQWFVFWTARTP